LNEVFAPNFFTPNYIQRKGVIKKFTVTVDPSNLGINTVAIVGLEVDPTKLLETSQKLCDFEEIKCVATSTGDHMTMMGIWKKRERTNKTNIRENRNHIKSKENLPSDNFRNN